ncbi:MAG: hypothetical protein PHT33_14555, partial [bacterium]|nr:hypothetical protein [bacterium]
CLRSREAKALHKDLYAQYKRWADDNGEHLMPNKAFSKALDERGIMRKEGAGNRLYRHGIGLNI